ncbi:sulfate ABC transporter permease [Vibrio sp. SS-MA-C1-2]|uniref:sulfate ABC transporter permease n=1 Tax=Vibrio sp. SS-MA-C1-2 TaxID=2908646 RepID=UPI001F1E6497|nr:sulfate ABC transporter permease [Vibrio sp. SS-MA-C1-2]UJF18142.1 sulfate ABC transporter permease [Vibrio sp. SS-MA-C1-2]
MKKALYFISPLLFSSPSFAVIDITENFTLSGFGSTSWADSDTSQDLLINRQIDDSGCFDCDLTFGLQLDYYYDNFKVSAQVVKRPQDDFVSPQPEWAYVGYSYDEFEFRAGILRLPLFLLSEYYYVGQAYTWSRPPQEVYNSALGITSYNGFTVQWNHELNDSTILSVSPFYGFQNISNVDLDAIQLKIDSDYTVGLNSQVIGENYKINFTFLNGTSNINSTIDFNGSSIKNKNLQSINFYTLGGEYNIDDLTLIAEGQTNDTSSSWYVGSSYNMDQLTPYLLYGQSYEYNPYQSVTTGLRLDFAPNASLNVEWQTFMTDSDSQGPFVAESWEQLKAFNPNYKYPGRANLYTVMVNFVF